MHRKYTSPFLGPCASGRDELGRTSPLTLGVSVSHMWAPNWPTNAPDGTDHKETVRSADDVSTNAPPAYANEQFEGSLAGGTKGVGGTMLNKPSSIAGTRNALVTVGYFKLCVWPLQVVCVCVRECACLESHATGKRLTSPLQLACSS
jgi:hypothetical protein